MRVSFRNRNLGYPLLTPEPRDYVSGGFDIEQPEARLGADAVTVHISYKLESEFLSGLVDNGDAAFYTLATCDRVVYARGDTQDDRVRPNASFRPSPLDWHNRDDAIHDRHTPHRAVQERRT